MKMVIGVSFTHQLQRAILFQPESEDAWLFRELFLEKSDPAPDFQWL